MFKKLVIFFIIIFVIVIGITFYAKKSPEKKALFWGIAMQNGPISKDTIDSITAQTHIVPQIIEFFLPWPSPDQISQAPFPEEYLHAIWKEKAVACIAWLPLYMENTTQTTIPFSDIVNGKYDEYIKTFAHKMKNYRKPVIIKLAPDMNLSSSHWGTEEKDFGPQNPEIYKKMVRHIISIFHDMKANNALWAFCPYAQSFPATESWNSADYYYPGDKYIDILGMDGYNYGFAKIHEFKGWDSQWESFAVIFKPLHDILTRISSQKPIIVFETGCIREGGNQIKWLTDAIDTASDWHLKGLIWFQGKKETDMRLFLPENSPIIEHFAEKKAQEWAEKLY